MSAIPEPPSGHSWTRVDAIDLLRGLSILFVVMNHANMRLVGAKIPYTRGLPPQLVDSLVWNGQFGVQMFFVISGYLITSTSLRRWRTPDRLAVKDFYLLRFARIAPLLLALLALLSVLHLLHVSGYVVDSKTGGLARALFAALTFHINYLEATRGYLPPNWDILWSLSVEETFYLFFPLVARALPRRKLLFLLLALLIAAGPFARARAFNHNPVWREYSYLGGMDAIAWGCLTAMLLQGRRLSRPWRYAAGTLGAALLLVSLALSDAVYSWGLGRNGLNMTVLALGTALVVAASAASRWKTPAILRPLQILGQRSYEIYLTHVVAVLALFSVFARRGLPLRGVPLLFFSTVVAAGLLGSVVAVAWTEPLNHLIRRRFQAGAAALGAATPDRD